MQVLLTPQVKLVWIDNCILLGLYIVIYSFKLCVRISVEVAINKNNIVLQKSDKNLYL